LNNLHVLFKVADTEYVLAAQDVLHMEPFEGATRVPGAPDYVTGLMQIRRRVVPVIDLRVRFGLQAATPALDSRVIVVQSGDRAVGLLVDSAREILSITADQFRPPPDLIVEQASGYVTSVAQAGARLLMLIDFRKVIGEEVPNGN
jgi:purine-binding chemotaxis protein CheW